MALDAEQVFKCTKLLEQRRVEMPFFLCEYERQQKGKYLSNIKWDTSILCKAVCKNETRCFLLKLEVISDAAKGKEPVEFMWVTSVIWWLEYWRTTMETRVQIPTQI